MEWRAAPILRDGAGAARPPRLLRARRSSTAESHRAASSHVVPERDRFRKERIAFAQRILESNAQHLEKHAVEIAGHLGGEKGAVAPHEAAPGLEEVGHVERASGAI